MPMCNLPEWGIPAGWKGQQQPIPVEGRCDVGRIVLINSVSGVLTNATGIVVKGPYKIVFRAKTKKGQKIGKDGKVKRIERLFITNPYWLVRLTSPPVGFLIHFAESELKFK